MNYTKKYEAPTLTVDSVVFRVNEGVLEVLLVRRQNEPFKGALALPGGYVAKGSTTVEALKHVTQEKGGISIDETIIHYEQLYTFDTAARDPRGHAVSVAYLCLGANIPIEYTGESAAFYPVHQLPALAFDHATIVKYAIQRLENKLTYTNIAYSLLPDHFTLSQLQTTYEAILNTPIDKRNFRKKILSSNMLADTRSFYKEGAHRPAKLYRFVHAILTNTYTSHSL